LTRAEMVVLLDKVRGMLPDMSGEAGDKSPIYTALGDSIAYGYGIDPEKSYVAMLYNYLKALPGNENMKLYNFSEIGADSSTLLKKVQNDDTAREMISGSDVITISVGGNNLLRPVIDLVCRAFDVEPGEYDRIGTDLMLAMLLNPERDKIIERLMEPENIPAALSDGVKRFREDWQLISAEIRALAPNARVYVITLYNPFPKNPVDNLYMTFDGFVQEINAIIGSPDSNYKVVDIYPLFNESSGKSQDSLTGFNLFYGRLDPHTNEKGHLAIFQRHLDEMEF